MIRRKQFINLLAGAVSFAVVTTILQYLSTEKLSFAGLVGGVTWFIGGFVIHLIKNKERENQ